MLRRNRPVKILAIPEAGAKAASRERLFHSIARYSLVMLAMVGAEVALAAVFAVSRLSSTPWPSS